MSPRGDQHARTRAAVDRVIREAVAEAFAEPDADAALWQAEWLIAAFSVAGSASARARAAAVRRIKENGGLSIAQVAERLGLSKSAAAKILKETAAIVRPAATEPPVAVAVVTSPLGVLVARRNDGQPPWTFPAGVIEPGETARQAAVRETLEETGLAVTAGRELGKRTHPDTGRNLVYVAAKPAADTAVTVADERELAEVRWVSLDQARELMPGMFDMVAAYIGRALR